MTALEARRFFTEERFGRGPQTPQEDRFRCTDAGNAELFAHLHRDLLRYDHKRSRWLEWKGHWWQEDKVELVVQLAKHAARHRFRQADSIDDLDLRKAVAHWAIQSEHRARIEACLRLARSEWPVADDGAGWDADRMLLALENGVLDLRTGALRAGRREDYITQHAPISFDPEATCPTFMKFIERVQPDADMRAYLQRRAGYSLTGLVNEQDLVLHYGGGANGKTTFANALMDTLGRDYATQAAPKLLLRSRGERHPTEVADLDGIRLLVSTEVDEGRALAEELVKQLTGGDRIKARLMRQDFFEFEPTFKIMLLANHKPEVRGTDLGIWRRIKLFPWDVTIPAEERDPLLREKLAAEAPGILNWMLAGFLDWQKKGMQEPPAVTAATQTYREESDPLGDFLTDRCVLGERYVARSAQVYLVYQSWAKDQGMSDRQVMSLTKFGLLMGARFRSGKDNRGKFYAGVGLREGAEIVTGLGQEDAAPATGKDTAELAVTGSDRDFESGSDGFSKNPVDRNSLSSHSTHTELPVNPSLPVTEPQQSGHKEMRL